MIASGFDGLKNLRISPTLSGLSKGWVRTSWQLPDPVSPIYNDSANRTNRADGGQSLRGQKSVILIWNDLGPMDTWQLDQLVETALAAGSVMYATINYGWGGQAPDRWVDVRGIVVPLQTQLADNSVGALHQQVTLTINALEVVNDPASL